MSDRMMLINWGANKKLVRIKENPVPGESLFNIFLEEDGERFGYTLTSNGVMTRGATEGLDKIVARFEHEIGNLSAWLLPGSEPFHAHVYSPFRGIIEFIPVKGRGYYLPEVKELKEDMILAKVPSSLQEPVVRYLITGKHFPFGGKTEHEEQREPAA